MNIIRRSIRLYRVVGSIELTGEMPYQQLVFSAYREYLRNNKPHTYISIKRGVRQENTISFTLFISELESIFQDIDCTIKYININGEYLNYLRFADDILITSTDIWHLEIE